MYKHIKLRSFRFESISHSFWYSLIFAGAFLGMYVGWLLTQNGSQINPAIPDVVVVLGAFASFVIAWLGSKRSNGKQGTAPLLVDRRLHFWVPVAFSIALLSHGV